MKDTYQSKKIIIAKSSGKTKVENQHNAYSFYDKWSENIGYNDIKDSVEQVENQEEIEKGKEMWIKYKHKIDLTNNNKKEEVQNNNQQKVENQHDVYSFYDKWSDNIGYNDIEDSVEQLENPREIEEARKMWIEYKNTIDLTNTQEHQYDERADLGDINTQEQQLNDR